MNLIVFLIFLAVLLTSIFWIIPTYAPQNKQEIIKDWLGIGFSGLLLLFALYETRAKDRSLSVPIVFYLFVLALCLSGVYWWIPKYVKLTEQNDAIRWLFTSTSIAIILANNISPAMKITL